MHNCLWHDTTTCARVGGGVLYSDGVAPWLGLEMPARAYCGGDFVARLLNDFNGGRRPRPRGARARTAGSAPNVND